jgi:membrane-bound lytic murein transglycosylase MltF
VAIAVVLLAGCSSPAPTEPPPPAADDAASARKPFAAAAPEPALTAEEIERLRAAGGGDLDDIRTRGHLRILVVPSRTEYAIDSGRQRGAVFNAGKALETFIKLNAGGGENRIRVVFIPVRNDALVADLNAGHGDIAANLLLTFARDDQVAFSEPVRKGVREVIVTGPGVPPIVSLEDVAGRAIHVRKSSDHHASLVRLNDQLAKVNKPMCKIVVADESLMDEDLVQLVNDGKIPATLVDAYVYRLIKATVPKVAVNEDVSVSQDGILAWAVRKDSPKLIALVNEFLKSHEGGR